MVKEKPIEGSSSRDQLLEAGTRLFAKHGLEGASVREIALEAGGLNVCMISYHFGGKEGLYRACLENYGRLRVELAREVLEPVTTAEELRIRLKLFVSAWTEASAKRPEVARIIAKEIDAGLPVARDIFESTFLKVMADVIEFFRSAQKAGIVRAELDPVYIAHILYGTIGHITRCDTIGNQYFKRTITDARDRERLVETLVGTITDGVLKRDH